MAEHIPSAVSERESNRVQVSSVVFNPGDLYTWWR